MKKIKENFKVNFQKVCKNLDFFFEKVCKNNFKDNFGNICEKSDRKLKVFRNIWERYGFADGLQNFGGTIGEII